MCICTVLLPRNVLGDVAGRLLAMHPGAEQVNRQGEERVRMIIAAMAVVALCAAAAWALSSGVAAAGAKPPKSFNPAVEAQNFSITQQRQTIYDTPQYQETLAVDSFAGF